MILSGITSGVPGYLAEISDVFELVTSAIGDGVSNDLPALISDVTIVSDAGGGTLKLRRGTYLLDDYGVGGILIAVPSNVRILGAGKDVSVVKSASTVDGHVVFGGTSVTNVQIESLTIDAVGTTNSSAGVNTTTATYCTVRNCRVTANFGWGVFLGSDTRECAVIDCVFDGTTTSHGVEINGSSYNWVTNCLFKGATGQQGIEIYDASATRCTGNRIIGNTFLAAGFSAIVAVGDINTVIANNVINAAQVTGITLTVSAYSGTRFSTGVTVTGNTINGCNLGGGSYGINVDQTLDCVISGNTITNTALAGDGIFVNGGTGGMLVGNVCSSNGGNGISLNDNVTRCAIIGNQCNNNSGTAVDSKQGLVCSGTFNSFIGNTGNDSRGGSARQYHGIYITGASNTVIGNRGTGNRNVNVNIIGATCQQFANDQTNTPTALNGYLGVNGATPVAQSTGWAVSNVTTDKVFDANNTTLDELADVVGTMITYFISRGDYAA